MFDFAAYFENVARKLKEIQHTDAKKHFFRSNSASYPVEILKSGSIAQYPAMVIIDRVDGRVTDRDSDNLLAKELYSFQILKPVPDSTPEGISTTVEECRVIVKKILSKMKRDKRSDNAVAITMPQTGLRNMEMGDVNYYQIGPMADGLYGIHVNFSITDPLKIKYNQEDWLE